MLVVKLKLVKKDKENMTFLKRVPNSEVVDGQEEEAPGPSEMRRLEFK